MSGPVFWELLTDRDREVLLTAAGSRIFRADAVLCMEGDPTTHVFILLSGWVKVTNATRDGREILVALYGGGNVFGEIAGRVTGYRTATVRAIGQVRTLVIGAERFEDFLDAHPAASRAYRKAIAQGQQAAYEYQRNQALSSAAQRLACLVLDLAGREGTADRDRAEIAPHLSQEELASLISASRSTVTRALREWRSMRIISTDQRHIEILDRARLLRIAGRLAGGNAMRSRPAPFGLRSRCAAKTRTSQPGRMRELCSGRGSLAPAPMCLGTRPPHIQHSHR